MRIERVNHFRPRARYSLFAVMTATILVRSVSAQEALRISRVSEEAAQLRRAYRELQPSNLIVGQGKVRLGASLSAEYNSNITFVERGEQSDFIFRPEASAELSLPITERN